MKRVHLSFRWVNPFFAVLKKSKNFFQKSVRVSALSPYTKTEQARTSCSEPKSDAPMRQYNFQEGYLMKRTKSLLAALTAITMAAPLVLPVVAETVDEEEAYVKVSVANAGTLELADETVPLIDADGNGSLTVNDVIIATHDRFYDGGAEQGYQTKTTEWGESIVKLWGVENGGSYGYTVNDQFASSLSDPLTGDEHVYFYVYKDAANYTDTYTYFEGHGWEDGPLSCGNSGALLKLNSITYDENWNPVIKPVEGAVITINGERTDYVTDANGEVDIEFYEVGKFVYSAELDGKNIVPPVARFWIDNEENITTEPLPTTTMVSTGELNHYHFASGTTDICIGETGYLSICGDLTSEFEIEDESIARIVRTERGTVYFEGVSAGETTLTATCSGWGTTSETIRVLDPAMTTTTAPYETFMTTTPTTVRTTDINGREPFYTNTTITFPLENPNPISFDLESAEMAAGEELTLTVLGYEDSNSYAPGESPIKFWLLDNFSADIVEIQGMSVTIKAWEAGSAVVHAQTPDGRAAIAFVQIREAYHTGTTDPFDRPQSTTFTTTTVNHHYGTGDVEIGTTTITTSTTNACGTHTGYGTTTTATTTGYDFYYFVPPTNREICVGELGTLSIVGGIDSDFEVETEGVIEVLNTDYGMITFRGIAPGETVITAHSKDGSYTAIAIVDVIDPASTTTFTTQTTAAYTGFTTTTAAIGGTDHDFILTSSTDPDYYIGTTSAFVTDEYPIDEESTTTTTETTSTGHHIHFLSERTTICVNETVAFRTCGGESADFRIEDESIAEIIEEESDFYNGYVVIRGLQPGETVLYGEGFDGTAVAYITVKEAAATSVVTGTEITGTTTVTTAEEPVFTTTTSDNSTRPAEDLPQTGNNNMTAMLVLIGTMALTGTGLTVLKRSGIVGSEEE